MNTIFSANKAGSHPPSWLAELPCWLLHKAKVPYYTDGSPRRGKLDSDEDRASLVTYEKALVAQGYYPGYGLGVALGEYDGLFLQGIDLDKLDEHPKLVPLLQDMPGYLEYSPSKNGIHALGLGMRFQSMGANTTGIEAYAGSRFFTFTGDTIRNPKEPADLASYIDTTLRPLHGGARLTVVHSRDLGTIPVHIVVLNSDQIDDLRSALTYIPADDYGTWVRIGLALKSAGDVGFELWDNWSQSAPDKYHEDEVVEKWESFNPTSTDYRAVFAEAQRRGWHNPRKARENDTDALIEELNRRHAVVRTGSKTRILDERRDELSFMEAKDFLLMYSNRPVEVDRKNGKTVSLGQYWLEHHDRRQYLGGVTFDPSGQCAPDVLNLWKGFSVSPDDAASCNRFLAHTREVICGGDESCFDYLLSWMASAVQYPERAPGVAVCFLSGQGTGKGVFMEYFAPIFGRHYSHLTQRSHLVGQFNGFLQDKVLIFADESVWAGNKQEASVLKGMLTEKTRTVERKYLDPFTVPNYTHLVIASNESFAVPAEIGDRRFFIPAVSPHRKGDTEYFQAIMEEADNGGREALLHLLLSVDLSNFNPAHFPRTAARVEQQLQNLESVDSWYYHHLYLGSLGVVVDGDFLSSYQQAGREQIWPKYAEKQLLYGKYCDWCRTTNQRRAPESIHVFTRTLLAYGVKSARPGRSGQDGRPRHYRFPELAAARQAFEHRLGYPVNWESESEEEEIEVPPAGTPLFAISK